MTEVTTGGGGEGEGVAKKKKKKQKKKAEGGEATPTGEEAPPSGDTSGILLSLRWDSKLSYRERRQTLILANEREQASAASVINYQPRYPS